jgi:hypothetical protein
LVAKLMQISFKYSSRTFTHIFLSLNIAFHVIYMVWAFSEVILDVTQLWNFASQDAIKCSSCFEEAHIWRTEVKFLTHFLSELLKCTVVWSHVQILIFCSKLWSLLPCSTRKHL